MSEYREYTVKVATGWIAVAAAAFYLVAFTNIDPLVVAAVIFAAYIDLWMMTNFRTMNYRFAYFRFVRMPYDILKALNWLAGILVAFLAWDRLTRYFHGVLIHHVSATDQLSVVFLWGLVGFAVYSPLRLFRIVRQAEVDAVNHVATLFKGV